MLHRTPWKLCLKIASRDTIDALVRRDGRGAIRAPSGRTPMVGRMAFPLRQMFVPETIFVAPFRPFLEREPLLVIE
jgi:hypothetical protein